ncbi:MAG: MoaD/ThiS family protein [Pseudomonadota bacterium]
MELSVSYFALYRDVTGSETEAVSTEASTPAELFAECQARYPGLERFEASLVAINDEMASWGAPLSRGDRVLFFPPVAGG